MLNTDSHSFACKYTCMARFVCSFGHLDQPAEFNFCLPS